MMPPKEKKVASPGPSRNDTPRPLQNTVQPVRESQLTIPSVQEDEFSRPSVRADAPKTSGGAMFTHVVRFVAVIGFVLIVYYGTKPADRKDAAQKTDPRAQTAVIAETLGTPSTSGSSKVKIYFNNGVLDPDTVCEKVFPAEREGGSGEPATAAETTLALLLGGPNEQEANDGYYTSISPGVSAKVRVADGVAVADFSSHLAYGVAEGSCRAEAIRAQITETLKQFDGIKEVQILLDGNAENIFSG